MNDLPNHGWHGVKHRRGIDGSNIRHICEPPKLRSNMPSLQFLEGLAVAQHIRGWGEVFLDNREAREVFSDALEMPNFVFFTHAGVQLPPQLKDGLNIPCAGLP